MTPERTQRLDELAGLLGEPDPRRRLAGVRGLARLARWLAPEDRTRVVEALGRVAGVLRARLLER